MNPVKILAILLIAGGALALGYRGFNYTKETHTADVGDLHIALAEKQHVTVPAWAAFAAIAGGVLLLASARKS